MNFREAYRESLQRPRRIFSTEMRDCNITLYYNDVYYLKGEGPPEQMLQFYRLLRHFTQRNSKLMVHVGNSLGDRLRNENTPSANKDIFIITREQLQKICSNVKYYQDGTINYGTIPWRIATIHSFIKDEQAIEETSLLEESSLRLRLPLKSSMYELTDVITERKGQAEHHISLIDLAMKRWAAKIYDVLAKKDNLLEEVEK